MTTFVSGAMKMRDMKMNDVIYLLQGYDLKELELETVLEIEGRKETTYKLVGTNEGGN